MECKQVEISNEAGLKAAGTIEVNQCHQKKLGPLLWDNKRRKRQQEGKTMGTFRIERMRFYYELKAKLQEAGEECYDLVNLMKFKITMGMSLKGWVQAGRSIANVGGTVSWAGVPDYMKTCVCPHCDCNVTSCCVLLWLRQTVSSNCEPK